MTKNEKPKYLEILDYRKIIEEFINWKKQTNRIRFTYSQFAKLCGFKSHNYVKLIIEGKRNITTEVAIKIAKAMDFNKRETEFFSSLTSFNQAKDPETKAHFFSEICRFKEFAHAHAITKDQFEYFSKWYNVAIRELVNLNGFKMDFEWISNQLNPKVPPNEVEIAIKLLKRLNLIGQTSSGKWKITTSHIRIGEGIASQFIMNFHKEMLILSQQSLKQERKDRKIMALTMTIGDKEFEEITKRIELFQKDIQNYLAQRKTKTNRVCQLNCQFFHIVKN